MKNCLIFLLFLFVSAGSGFSQTITVSEPFPESGRDILGIWKSKIVSTLGQNEVFIVDKKLAYSREQVLLKPKLAHHSESWLMKVLMHGKYLYEVHYIFEEKKVIPAKAKRNVLVKRDIETLEIVEQKELPHNLLNLKFCIPDESGFFLCLGTTNALINPDGVYQPKLANRKVIPRMLYRFDYDLEQKWSLDLSEYDAKTVRTINEWTTDEAGNLLIPVWKKDEDKLNDRYAFASLDLLVIEPSGNVKDLDLDVPELEFEIASAHMSYDVSNRCVMSRMIVTERFGKEAPYQKRSGFYFVKWDLNGRIIYRNQEWFHYPDFLSDENSEYLKSLNLNEGEDHAFELLPDNNSYHAMPNGDVFFISDKVEDDNEKLLNSKIFFMISAEGTILWKKLLVYDNHRIYNYHSWAVDGANLYLYVREYNDNVRAGVYTFYSSFVNTNGTNIDLYLRTIDLFTGKVKSIVPVFPDNTWQYEPEPFVYVDPVKKTHLVRYKNPKMNQEKMVTLTF